MADIFREPLFTPIPKRAVLPAESFRNTVLLAALVVSTPFKPVDFPTPVYRRDGTASQELSTVAYLSVVTGAPFRQNDWPNPLRARIFPQGDSLSGVTTRDIVPPPPVRSVDFPVPVGRKPQRFDDPPNLIFSTLKPTATAPFLSVDLGQPFKVRPIPQSDSQTGVTTRGIPPPPPVKPFDWPNPTAVRPIRFDYPPNLLAGTLKPAFVPPFKQTDWPNPQPWPRATPQSREQYSAAIYIPKPPVLPFSQKDWPLFARARTFTLVMVPYNVAALTLKPVIPPSNQIGAVRVLLVSHGIISVGLVSHGTVEVRFQDGNINAFFRSG